jgi:acylphosphatase
MPGHKAGHDEAEFVAMSNKADPRRTVSVKIEGLVQGVYYRAWTEHTARALGLDGTVRNAGDGSVEAVFSGPAVKVDAMLRHCAEGPPDARVTKVTVTEEGGSVPPGFRVLGTNWR